ncbi:MAG: hypothetical protein CMH45_00720, partial [Muricauda sp.]|nr:hypothetical protein [Allomuricauda sp.]
MIGLGLNVRNKNFRIFFRSFWDSVVLLVNTDIINGYAMKNTLKQLSLFLLALTLTLGSCREEESVFIEGPEEETLAANSNIANLLQNTATKDGSADNIIDNASCITIELPVSVVVNDLEIIVDSPEDFETIEDIFDEFEDDEDVLEIIFPITIVLSDFTELVINDL